MCNSNYFCVGHINGYFNAIICLQGWLGSHRLQTNLPIEQVLKILHTGQAPTPILDKFLAYVDNIDKRLQLAQNFSCAKTIIEVREDKIKILSSKLIIERIKKMLIGKFS